MTLEQLFALGATCVCGALDLNNKNIGRLTADGPVISDEGKEILADLQPKPAADPKPKRSKKVVEAAPAEADDEIDLSAEFDKLL